jgi:thiamine monophosphate synthase
MRYITVWADYRSTGVRDNFVGPLKEDELEVSDALWADLQEWVADYAPITIAGTGVTKENASDVRRLDIRGLALTRRIADELKPTAKIEYFSEGLLEKIQGEAQLNGLLGYPE